MKTMSDARETASARRAIEDTYRRRSGGFLAWARRHAPDAEAAEDAVQDAFLRALANADALSLVQDVAHEMRGVLRIKAALEVIPGSPQMVLGHELHLSSGHYFRRHVGRAGKVRPIGIALENHLRQNFPRDLVVRRIQA